MAFFVELHEKKSVFYATGSVLQLDAISRHSPITQRVVPLHQHERRSTNNRKAGSLAIAMCHEDNLSTSRTFAHLTSECTNQLIAKFITVPIQLRPCAGGK